MASARREIRLRITVPYAVVTIALLAAGVLVAYSIERFDLDRETRAGSERVQYLFTDLLEHEARVMSAQLAFIRDDAEIIAAWRGGEREQIYQAARGLFERLKRRYGVTHFYFIGVDGRCVLRVHAPPRHGDLIGRHTLDQAVRTMRQAWGIELGVLGTFTLRVVQPWLIEGKLVGYLELGEEIEHLTPHVKALTGLDLIFAIFKSKLSQAQWAAGAPLRGKTFDWGRFDRIAISDTSLARIGPQLDGVLRRGVAVGSDIVRVSVDGHDYAVTAQPLRDASGAQIGLLYGLRDVTARVSNLRRSLMLFTGGALPVGLVLLLFLFVYGGRIGGRLDGYALGLEEMVSKRTDALQRALDDVKVLKGLLPICAGCKKIRDDDGQWQPIERYVSDHSEATFTHGLCPECAKRLYAELPD